MMARAGPASTTAKMGFAALERRQWATMLIFTLSMFIVVLDATVMLVALPSIVENLDGALTLATWVPAGFSLSFAAFLLLFGKLTRHLWQKAAVHGGLVVFIVASLGAALAPSFGMPVAPRVAQGISSDIVEPAIIAVSKSTFRSTNSTSRSTSKASLLDSQAIGPSPGHVTTEPSAAQSTSASGNPHAIRAY